MASSIMRFRFLRDLHQLSLITNLALLTGGAKPLLNLSLMSSVTSVNHWHHLGNSALIQRDIVSSVHACCTDSWIKGVVLSLNRNFMRQTRFQNIGRVFKISIGVMFTLIRKEIQC